MLATEFFYVVGNLMNLPTELCVLPILKCHNMNLIPDFKISDNSKGVILFNLLVHRILSGQIISCGHFLKFLHDFFRGKFC